MKKFFIILLIVAVAGCLNAQNYVFIGLAPMYNFQNASNALQSTVTNTPFAWRAYTSATYSLTNLTGGTLSFGYRGHLGKGFYLGGSGEFAIQYWGLLYNNDLNRDITIVTSGLSINFQKVFNVNERINLFTGASLGFNYLPKTDNSIILNNYSYMPVANIDINGDTLYSNVDNSTLTFNASANLNAILRPSIGIQYKLRNGARVELGLSYNYNIDGQVYIDYNINETIINSTQGTSTLVTNSYEVTNFRPNQLMAEVKYCIPLVPLKAAKKAAM